MARCLLALGSNLGDRRAILGRACAALACLTNTQLLARSRWHATAPIGGPDGQGEFLNGAVVLQTSLEPADLATQLHAIEAELGRERVVRWDARVIDIDLLLYGMRTIDLPSLTVPHPRMSFRRFVLEPAVEIAGDWVHPAASWTLFQLLSHLQKAPRRIEIIAANRCLADWLAGEIASVFSCSDGENYQGDPNMLLSVESIGDNNTQPRVVASQQLPNVGGQVASQTSSLPIGPALSIALKPCSPEKLLAAIEAKNVASDKKNQKTFSENFGENTHLQSGGPRLVILSDEPTTVVQEAVAAISSAWPNLSVN